MKIASITDTKNNLSFYLDMVRSGETVLITDRNKPVARLEPVDYSNIDAGGRLDRLERAGIIHRSKKKNSTKEILQTPVPAIKGVDILKVLLKERAEGR